MKREVVITIAATSAFSTSVGFFAGAYIVRKKVVDAMEVALDAEIEQTKQFYSRLYKTGEFATPETAAAAIEEEDAEESKASLDLDGVPDLVVKKVERTNYNAVSTDEVEVKVDGVDVKIDLEDAPDVEVTSVEVKSESIFVDDEPIARDSFDLEEEMEKRQNGMPYVISRDEFNENEFDFETIVLTWFYEELTMVDSEDKVVPNPEAVLGDTALTLFGHGSKDRNVVYVCNEESESLFEVIKTRGSYSENVLGFIQHSDDPPRRRSKRVYDE